jgi:hypothetical protein
MNLLNLDNWRWHLPKSTDGKIGKLILTMVLSLLIQFGGQSQVKDQLYPLPANSVHLQGYLEDYIQNSLDICTWLPTKN